MLWNRSADSESAPGMQITRERLDHLAAALIEAGFTVADANCEDDPDRIGHAVVVARPTFIFNLVDHFYGDNTQHPAVAGLLDLFGYQYTGSDPLCLSTCMDRARTRLILQDGGVPVPGFAVVRDVNTIPPTDDVEPPFIVSQALDDIYHLHSARAELTDRDQVETRTCELAAEFEMPLLIEEYVAGRRISAIAIGNRVLDVLPLCETVRDGENSADQVVIAQLDVDAAGRVRELARQAFRVMGCRDLAKVDFVVTDAGYVLCTDVRPSVDVLSEAAAFHVAAENTELGYDGAVAAVARCTYDRVPLTERPQPPPLAAPADQNEAPAGENEAAGERDDVR